MSDKLIKQLRDGLKEGRIKPLEIAQATLDALTEVNASLENARMQLVACQCVANANTRESAEKARDMREEYKSPALIDVIRAVDREMDYREELDQLKQKHSDSVHEVQKYYAKKAAEFEARIPDIEANAIERALKSVDIKDDHIGFYGDEFCSVDQLRDYASSIRKDK